MSINPDGSGEVSAGLVINQMFAEAVKEQSLLSTTGSTKPSIESGTIDGQFVRRETLVFDSLDEIGVQDSKIEIQNFGREYYFFGPNSGRIVLRQTLEGAEEATSNSNSTAGGAALLAPLFSERTYRLEITVPGDVTEAKQLRLDENVAIQSQVEGSTVTWTIPMPLLLQHSEAELLFDISFTGTFSFANATSADHKRHEDGEQRQEEGPAT